MSEARATKTVLVVDHDPVVRQQCQQVLEGEGLRVRAGESKQDLLREVAENKPDLVLLGLFLRDGPSYPVMGELGKLPVVGLAAVFEGPTVRRLLMQRYGFVEVLDRPLAGANLVECVRLQLGLYYPDGSTPQAVDDANRSEPLSEDETTFVGRLAWEFAPTSEDTRVDSAELAPDEGHEFKRMRTAPKLRPVGTAALPAEMNWRQAGEESSLESVAFPAVMARVFHTRHTGALLLWRQRVRKIAYFESGRPVSMRSNLLFECLGNVLVREGHIDEATCQASVERAQAEGRRQGEVLLAMGALSREQLGAALSMQLRERLLDVFGWTDGRYQIQSLKLTPSVAPLSREETAALIFEGVLDRCPPPRILSALSPCWSCVPTLRVERSQLEHLPLRPEHYEVLDEMSGGGSLLELVAQFEHSTRVHPLVYALVVLGYVTLEG